MSDREGREAANLTSLFRPESVAVVGASNDTNKFGGKVAHNIGRSRIARRYYINAKGGTIQGQKAYRSLGELPSAPEVVVLAVAAQAALNELCKAAEMGVRAAVLFAAGFREAGEEGIRREAELKALATKYGLAVIGPNCVGAANFADQVFLSSADGLELRKPGPIALISQSGSLGIAVSSRQEGRFRYQITTGNESVLKTHQLMEALLELDAGIRTFALLMEAIHDPSELSRVVAVAQAKGKRVVLLKLAGSAEAGKIAALHTGAVSGEMAPLEAYCRDNGILLAHSLREFYAVLTLLSTTDYDGGKRVGIYTASGGTAVLGADFAKKQGLQLPAPEAAARAVIADLLGSQPDRITNPLDTTGIYAYNAQRFVQALREFASPKTYDLVLVPLGGAGGETALQRIEALEQVVRTSPVPLVPVWQQLRMLEEDAFHRLYNSGITMFTDYEAPLEAMALISGVDESTQESAQQESAPHESDVGVPFKEALLSLEEYKVPIASVGVVSAGDDPMAVFAKFGQPVAIKVNHPELLHKSDSRLVVFPVDTPGYFRAETSRLAAEINRLGLPDAEIVVQSGVTGGIEMLCGFARDVELGPYVVLGAGGIYTEILKDSGVALLEPPNLEDRLRCVIEGLRIWEILKGTRGNVGYDWQSAIQAILRVADYFCENTSVSAMELNPLTLLPGKGGAKVVDARIIRCR